MTLEEYHRLHPLPAGALTLYRKAGARGLGDGRWRLLAQVVRPQGARAIDLNPALGLASVPLVRAGLEVEMLEPSRAALRCLKAAFGARPGVSVRAALPWEARAEHYDQALLVLPAERGQGFTHLSLLGAARALRPGGQLWLCGDKNKGFERQFKAARALLGEGEVVERDGPLRVALLRKHQPSPALPDPWTAFPLEARGRPHTFYSLPGVFSAGQLDPASALLLEALEGVAGLDVLDLGGGYGALGLSLAAEGARATLLEDDLAGVLSARRSAEGMGLEANVVHSDVDEGLPNGALFDIVLSNPPFHVGGSLILDVAHAFITAAHARLRPGGRFYLVANPFLKYEPLLQALFGSVRTLAVRNYKVLLAHKGRGPR
ncbi:Ribosomal RNA small subunit methyltransferase C [Calidithermus terrae]|uniref:Ribosomal RNA small subunit methyltransferase C n=1 Tax=Calidithermus terrae TaxID=1408545 RepID=A0A399EYD7_9DEIN|nr:methyltransferase [Calidithermus terrae]RIH88783.1 Ribosomal RNA small subunit methyltransferase C [Calidithermus terrae]